MALRVRGLAVNQVIKGWAAVGAFAWGVVADSVGLVGTFFLAAAPTGVARDPVPTPRGEHHDNGRRVHDDPVLVTISGDEPGYR